MKNHTEADEAEYFLPVGSFAAEAPEAFSSRILIDFGSISHAGRVRDKNEDAFLIFRTGRYWQKLSANMAEDLLPERHEEMAYAMAVADGMGGLASGELASSTALNTIVNLMLSSVKWAHKLDHPELREQEIQEAIERAIDYLVKADLAVARRAREEPDRAMGTTLTATYSFGDDLFIFHIGDSRAYQYRDGMLKRLTRDHTLAQELADIGGISEDEVSRHYLKHILTRAIGRHGEKLEVEIDHLKLKNDDMILLCTDGLTDIVRDPEIAKILRTQASAQEKCQQLADFALDRGAKDNVTVLLAGYKIPEA